MLGGNAMKGLPIEDYYELMKQQVDWLWFVTINKMFRNSVLAPQKLLIVGSRNHQNAARSFDDLPSLSLGEIARFANPFSVKHMKPLFETLFEKYGNIFKLRYPGSKYYQAWTCNPLDGQELLRNDGNMPITTGFDFFVYYRNKVIINHWLSLIVKAELIHDELLQGPRWEVH